MRSARIRRDICVRLNIRWLRECASIKPFATIICSANERAQQVMCKRVDNDISDVYVHVLVAGCEEYITSL